MRHLLRESYGTSASSVRKTSRFTEALIVAVLHEWDAGAKTADCRSRKRMVLERVPNPAISGANQRWSMDFVSDALAG